MKILFPLLIVLVLLPTASCSNDDGNQSIDPPINKKYLALGDSYTIGESVCESCRFPAQLSDSLETEHNFDVSLKIIAQTGWTTTNLKSAIAAENLASDYDLVTLLIGVNNQFQNKPFSLYESEFPELVNTAIVKGKGDKNNVVVVSIPDYAYTPYGQSTSNPQNISSGIDAYNAFAENYCLQNDIKFVNITDITRRGLNEPELVASDGLHPSEIAYSEFVTRMLSEVLEALD